ncbi:MAG: tetratricopeptide repeat protein [Verrucomicrobiaceae bacterium]
MKVPYLHCIACAVTTVFLVNAPGSHAVDLGKANPLNWFKQKEESAPDNQQKQGQEAAAAGMMRDAKTAISTGNNSRAQDIYKSVVKQYPFTTAAAEAQFEYARLLRVGGKLQDSFDAFQIFITKYRESQLFANAVQEQFEIAEEARSGKKSERVMLVIPSKVGSNDLVKMYQGIIKNAPYSKYAGLSQFAIGEVYQDKGEKLLADTAFQAVVDNYPNTPQSAEAQFRIGAISSSAAKRTQDSSNIVRARDALEVYKSSHPTGERIGEVESMKQQTNEISAARSLQIAGFYEKAGKPKAAAIYYNEALKNGSADSALKARERLASLSAAHPEDMKDNLALGESDFTIPAAMNLKNREDYVGPPAPELAKLGKKPKMRVEKDDFMPIPLREPELPTRPVTAPAPGMLIPPVAPDKNISVQLPVPPAPGTSPLNSEIKIEPKADDAKSDEAKPTEAKPADPTAPKSN